MSVLPPELVLPQIWAWNSCGRWKEECRGGLGGYRAAWPGDQPGIHIGRGLLWYFGQMPLGLGRRGEMTMKEELTQFALLDWLLENSQAHQEGKI
jgi:hypothetical protein